MKKIKFFLPALSAFGVLIITGCTPADIDYCSKYDVAGTPEYGKCLDYFHRQEALFKTDLDVCNLDADQVYPPTLYDYGHTEHYVGGYGPYGHYYGGGFIDVPPDYEHNVEVDRLRLRIVAPCMDARGWNSPITWQAGRHAPAPAKRSTQSAKLPWAN